MLSINLISQRKQEKIITQLIVFFFQEREKTIIRNIVPTQIIIMICVGTKFSRSLYAKAFKSFTLPYLNIINHLLVEIL